MVQVLGPFRRRPRMWREQLVCRSFRFPMADWLSLWMNKAISSRFKASPAPSRMRANCCGKGNAHPTGGWCQLQNYSRIWASRAKLTANGAVLFANGSRSRCSHEVVGSRADTGGEPYTLTTRAASRTAGPASWRRFAVELCDADFRLSLSELTERQISWKGFVYRLRGDQRSASCWNGRSASSESPLR